MSCAVFNKRDSPHGYFESSSDLEDSGTDAIQFDESCNIAILGTTIKLITYPLRLALRDLSSSANTHSNMDPLNLTHRHHKGHGKTGIGSIKAHNHTLLGMDGNFSAAEAGEHTSGGEEGEDLLNGISTENIPSPASIAIALAFFFVTASVMCIYALRFVRASTCNRDSKKADIMIEGLGSISDDADTIIGDDEDTDDPQTQTFLGPESQKV